MTVMLGHAFAQRFREARTRVRLFISGPRAPRRYSPLHRRVAARSPRARRARDEAGGYRGERAQARQLRARARRRRAQWARGNRSGARGSWLLDASPRGATRRRTRWAGTPGGLHDGRWRQVWLRRRVLRRRPIQRASALSRPNPLRRARYHQRRYPRSELSPRPRRGRPARRASEVLCRPEAPAIQPGDGRFEQVGEAGPKAIRKVVQVI